MAYSANANNGRVTPAKTPVVFSPYSWDWRSDFNVVKTTPEELRLVSNKSPLGRETAFRFGYTNVSNIYNNSGIDRAVQDQHKTGVRALVGCTKVYTFTDAETGSTYDKPAEAHLIMTVGKDPAVDVALITDLIATLMSGLYDYESGEGQGTATLPTRMLNMLRGILLPQKLG